MEGLDQGAGCRGNNGWNFSLGHRGMMGRANVYSRQGAGRSQSGNRKAQIQ